MKRRPPPPKHDLNDLSGLRVGLYCRVSDDPQGNEKSVDDQEREGRRWVDRQGATLTDIYRDSDISASRFTTKQRPDYIRLKGDIRTGRLNLVWFWELSRSQRRLDHFAELRDLCRDLGVLWCVAGRVYDLSNYMDSTALGLFAVFGESESEVKSARVLRGLQSIADAGRPHAVTPYGYRRRYNDSSSKRELLRQEPNYFDGDGATIAKDSPADVVQEIFTRIAAGHSITAIEKDLNARRIPSPSGGEWRRVTIRKIAANPAYIGRRIHQGRVIEGVKAIWPALVDEETFEACQRILSDPARTTTRPGRAKHLLSWMVKCAECDGPLAVQKMHQRDWQHRVYWCFRKRCTSIKQQTLDDYVERAMIRWLSDPETVADLTRGEDSPAADQARAEAAQLRIDLGEWRQLAEAGEVTPTGYARAEKGLLKRIAEAEQRAQAATVPAVLRGNIGPQAKAGWAKLDVAVKRQIIAAVADIRLRRVGRGGYRSTDMEDRLEWDWLVGPGADQEQAG